jgi:acid phosphatase
MRFPARAMMGAALIVTLAGALAPTPAAAQAAAIDCAKVKPFNEQWPINIGLLATALRQYHQCSYDADVKAVLDAARAFVVEEAPRVAKAAVVLDIDETSLSNWALMDHNDFAYVGSGACDLRSSSACGQQEWEHSARAPAIAPTLELFNALKELKDKDGNPVAVFFVTGRHDDPFERIATEYNLRRAGYDGWNALFMRPDHPPGEPVSAYKSATRALIENGRDYGYRIIANIGDQISDLEGGHATRCFKVPNPFYYIPGEVDPHAQLDCLRP